MADPSNKAEALAQVAWAQPVPCQVWWTGGQLVVLFMDTDRPLATGVVPTYAEVIDPDEACADPALVIAGVCARAVGLWAVSNG